MGMKQEERGWTEKREKGKESPGIRGLRTRKKQTKSWSGNWDWDESVARCQHLHHLSGRKEKVMEQNILSVSISFISNKWIGSRRKAFTSDCHSYKTLLSRPKLFPLKEEGRILSVIVYHDPGKTTGNLSRFLMSNSCLWEWEREMHFVSHHNR